MQYAPFARGRGEEGPNAGRKELGGARMAHAVLGRGMVRPQVPKVEEMAAADIRAQLPRFHSANVEKNLRLRSALEAIARAKKRHARRALHRLADGPVLACGSLHRTDTWRQIAQAP